jgi:hypothetical protein
MHVHVHIDTYTHIHTYRFHECMYTSTHVHTHLNARFHACTYTYTHIHTNTRTLTRLPQDHSSETHLPLVPHNTSPHTHTDTDTVTDTHILQCTITFDSILSYFINLHLRCSLSLFSYVLLRYEGAQ